MKKILMTFAISALLLSSCKDSNECNDISNDNISVSVAEITADPAGATSDVVVKSSGAWRISGICDWARPSALSGQSGETVTFTVDPNKTDDTKEAIFKVFSGSAVTPIKVVSTAKYVIDLVTDSELKISNMEGEFTIKVNTNISDLSYEFTNGGEEWLSFLERNDAFGPSILRFQALENLDYDSREAELRISGLTADPVVVKITQAQKDHLEVGSLSYVENLTEGNISVNVKTNVEYTIAITEAWIEQIESRALNSQTLNFRLQAAVAVRTGYIVLTPKNSTLAPVRIRVVQRDPNASTVKIPDEAFRTKLLSLNMIAEIDEGQCYLTEAGLNATSLSLTPGYYDRKIVSVEGIENFSNLTSIDASGNSIKVFDISKLTKVKTLNVESNMLSELHLGDNDILTVFLTRQYVYDYSTGYTTPSSFTVSSSKLKELTNTVYSYIDDSMSMIDVSECPSLTTLQVKRKAGVLKQLYFKNEAHKNQLKTLSYAAGAEILYKE